MKTTIQFWSSTEYGGFLKGLVRALNDHENYHVRQRFLISEVQYRKRRTFVSRLWLRFLQYVGYPVYLCYCLLKPGRADIVVVSSNTFYAPLIASWLHPNVIHLVYDLFPEALIISRKIGAQGVVARTIRWSIENSVRRARLNVALGPRLRDYMVSAGAKSLRMTVIPVGTDATLFEQAPREPTDGKLSILYCGNLGYMHDLSTIQGALGRLAGSNKAGLSSIEWSFLCSGPRANFLQGTIMELSAKGSSNVHMSSGLPQDEWLTTMEAAHIALVTMVPGAEKVVMPSKTYSAMCAGQAILAIAPEASDLVDLIKHYDCGWWVEPGDVDGLCELIRRLSDVPDEVLQKRRHAFEAGHANYSQEVLSERWIELFESILKNPDRRS